MVHVLRKHMFKMQQICAYTTKWKCMFATFVTPQNEGSKRGTEKKSRKRVRKRRIETEMILWSESFSSVCLSSTPNEWQMLQGGLLTTAGPLKQITHTRLSL